MSEGITKDRVYEWLSQVADPEVPVLTVLDMGVIRDVQLNETTTGTEATITITPTYSGCPAMDMISMNIRMSLLSRGIAKVHFIEQLSPAWTTDWMSEEGKRKLKEYGIAPPQRKASRSVGMFEEEKVPCPRCNSEDTELVSQFGPTSCKSLYRCLSCKEPFEHFKCH